MKKNNKMDIVFILDKSGSMYDYEQDTIGNYNSYIDSQREKNVNVTTVLFDDKYKMILKRENIKNVKPLTTEDYQASGCTALYDAIGKTINFMDEQKPEKTIFIITTDGYENASIEYSRKQIKKMIEEHDNWEFIYLGTDIDSYTASASIGIKASHSSNYSKTKKGIQKAFDAISKVCNCFYDEIDFDESWKEDLED